MAMLDGRGDGEASSCAGRRPQRTQGDLVLPLLFHDSPSTPLPLQPTTALIVRARPSWRVDTKWGGAGELRGTQQGGRWGGGFSRPGHGLLTGEVGGVENHAANADRVVGGVDLHTTAMTSLAKQGLRRDGKGGHLSEPGAIAGTRAVQDMPCPLFCGNRYRARRRRHRFNDWCAVTHFGHVVDFGWKVGVWREPAPSKRRTTRCRR